MITAAAYVVIISGNRGELLLKSAAEARYYYYYRFGRGSISEPVPSFDHSRRAPLIVLLSFEPGLITHIADGRRGPSAGTGLSRLDMSNLEALVRPLAFKEVAALTPISVRHHVRRVFEHGGKLPPKSLGAVVDALIHLDGTLSHRLSRFSDELRRRIANLGEKERNNLALQKESVTAALEITGIETDEILNWSLGEVRPGLFLEGLSEVRVREDAMLISDLSAFPGFDTIREFNFAARTFESERDRSLRVTVIMANKLPLEEQTGADLIYFNEKFFSFVFVQYKAMEKEREQHVFRWRYGDQFEVEIDRMDSITEKLRTIADDNSVDGFRLSQSPFFIKLCPRVILNPDDKGLIPGMYLPLDYWKRLAISSATAGPHGGRYVSVRNVGRKLSNSDFIAVVAGAWVGTTVPQSVVMSELIRGVLQSGKALTFAVKRTPPPDRDGRSTAGSIDCLEDDDNPAQPYSGLGSDLPP